MEVTFEGKSPGEAAQKALEWTSAHPEYHVIEEDAPFSRGMATYYVKIKYEPASNTKSLRD